MSNKSSGTSEGAGDGVERPEDAEVEGAQRSETQGPETDDAADEDSDDEAKSEKAKSEPASKRDDDGDDADDDDDDDDDRVKPSKAAPARPSAAPAKAKAERASTGRRRAAKARDSLAPMSEAEIDSPSKQTLGMLGVVAAATLVMWGVGRAECNYNEVGEGMKPREVSLEERTRTPKDLAFAFQHSLASYDFATAKKLATGDAKKLVEQREQACKTGCDEKKKRLASEVASVAELLKRTASHALTRVWSEGGEDPKKHLAVLKREGRGWLVESYRPDTGAPVELPGEVPASIPGSVPGAPGLPPGATSAMPPGHPPVPGYGLDPHRGHEGSPKLPSSGAPPPTAGTRAPGPSEVKPTQPAPGAAQPAPAGAAKPPAGAP